MGVYVCSIEATLGGQTIANVLGVRDDEGATESEAEALDVAEKVGAAWAARICPQVQNSYVLTGVTARGLHTKGLIAYKARNQAGARTQQSFPGFVVAKVKLFTATPGRAGTGRTGISGIGEDYNDGAAGGINHISAAYQATLQTAFDGFRADLASTSFSTGGPMTLMVISRFLNKAKRAEPQIAAVTSSKVDSIMGSRVTRLR